MTSQIYPITFGHFSEDNYHGLEMNPCLSSGWNKVLGPPSMRGKEYQIEIKRSGDGCATTRQWPASRGKCLPYERN